MEKHPCFDLWLHTSQELTELLSVEINERTTLHEWPLSCVQLLKLADGSRLIYKSQFRATTVEPELYAAVQNNRALDSQVGACLPRARQLDTLRDSVTMTLEFIDAPRLDDLQMDEAAIFDHGERLLSEIHRFPLDLPVYMDISSLDKWIPFTEETFSMLDCLVRSGQFRLTTDLAMRGLISWARSESVRAAIQSPPALIHHDLGGDNVFITPDGYKIIDWQRPVRGPADLDRAGYLTAMGVDPLRHTSPAIIGLFWFLRMRWVIECKTNWFPVGEVYDQQVVEFTDQILKL
jgi:hypothetical protein